MNSIVTEFSVYVTMYEATEDLTLDDNALVLYVRNNLTCNKSARGCTVSNDGAHV